MSLSFRFALSLVLCGAMASFVQAVNPITNSAFQTVTVDGSSNFADGAAVSVLNDGGTYRMWYRNVATDDGSIGQLKYATSTNGINFTSAGSLSFTSDPFTGGTAPYLYYENVSEVAGDFKIQHWTYNGGDGTFPAYNYNISISDAGSGPSNVVTHQGAVSGGTGGQTAGSFGIVGGSLYGQGGTGRELASGVYTDGTTSVASFGSVKDFQSLFDGLGISSGYINNHSDVIDFGGGNLGLYFTVRDGSGFRFDQQVYYAESSDNGATWTDATTTLSSPTLDGGAFGGNFAHADVVPLTGGGYGLYIGSQNANGQYVVATNAIPEPATLVLAGLAVLGLAGLARRRT